MGSYLVDALRDQGHEVHAAVNYSRFSFLAGRSGSPWRDPEAVVR
jgi:nucleoside-diphosphate-sugar epimerase